MLIDSCPPQLPGQGWSQVNKVSEKAMSCHFKHFLLNVRFIIQFSFDKGSIKDPWLLFTSPFYYLNCSPNTHILMTRQKVNQRLCILDHIWYMIYHLGCHFLRQALLNWRTTREGNQDCERFKIIDVWRMEIQLSSWLKVLEVILKGLSHVGGNEFVLSSSRGQLQIGVFYLLRFYDSKPE